MLWLKQQQFRIRGVRWRRRTVDALCRKPVKEARVVALLLGLLGDADAEVRCVAMTAIGKSDDSRRGEAIRRTLGDADPSVRNAAILAAKRLKDETLVDSLADILLDPDFAVRGSGALALEALGWRPKDVAEEIRLCVARGHLHRAAALGPEAIAPLEGVLKTGPVSLRTKAVDALSRIDDEKVLPPLLAALNAEETAVCVTATEAIGRICDPALADSLVPLLKHKESLVRTTAADALGKLGHTKALEAIALLLKDEHWDTRRMAADALAKLKDPRAVPTLAATLEDSDCDVRESCALALGAIRDRSGIAPLVRALQDPASSVRRIAAAALARIDEDWSASAEAQPILEELKMAEANRPAGIRGGGRGRGDSLVMAGKADPGRTRKHAVNLFTSILGEADRDLRLAAAEALGRLGGPRAEAVLVRALRDPDPGVQAAVEQALQKFGGVATPTPNHA